MGQEDGEQESFVLNEQAWLILDIVNDIAGSALVLDIVVISAGTLSMGSICCGPRQPWLIWVRLYSYR